MLPAAIRMLRPASWRQVLLFARQSLLDPYQGSVLGAGWLVLLPLIQILIYTLIFSRFMGARIGTVATPFAYSLYLVPGLLLWVAFANTVNNMASVYSARAHIIRKVPVSLVGMPAYLPLVELCLWGLAMALFAVFCVVIGHGLSPAWLLLPLICISTLALAYGIGLLLAALSLFAPDLRQLASVVIQLAFWLTPIVYVVDILPAWFAAALRFHPVYWGISQAQQIVLHGRIDRWDYLALQLALSAAVLMLARWLVRHLEKDIRDLL